MLKFRGTDVQTLNIHLDLVGYGESPLVRGEDHVMPGASGRERGSRRHDVLRFVLQGYVQGTGTDPEERALSWRDSTDELLGLMDLALDPGTVEVGPEAPERFPDAAPYLGLTDERMLNARCVSMVRGPVLHHMSFQSWSFEMECIDSPPEWQDASS